MLFSKQLIEQFIDLGSVKNQDLIERIILSIAEIEEEIDYARFDSKIVTGRVLVCEAHPQADRLQVATVEVGRYSPEPLTIVCGGSNLAEGQIVPVALVGAQVGEMEIKPAKLRGVPSEGMICSASELGLAADDGSHSIMVLPFDTKVGVHLDKVIDRDLIFDIENKSMTHRPDLFSHFGMARDIAACLDLPFPKHKLPKVKLGTKSVKVKITDCKDCPRYSAMLIEGIIVGSSDFSISSMLSRLGSGPHNNIVDITNLIMLQYGQPLHAFDADKIDGTITVRRAKPREKFTDLLGKKHQLTPQNLVIADDKKVLALAGVIGGADSAVTEQTTRIVLESANFHPTVTRLSAQAAGIRTDASTRFEKSLDPSLTPIGLLEAAALIKVACPQSTLGKVVDKGKFQFTAPKISFDPQMIRTRSGIDISDEEIITTLRRLSFGVAKAGAKLRVTVPSHRATKDISIPEDLLEEVVRVYGYEKIVKQPIQATCGRLIESPDYLLERSLRHQLSNTHDLNEIISYAFYSADEARLLGSSLDQHLHLRNFLSSEYEYMRTSLLPGLLRVAEQNLRYFDQVSLYELGAVYHSSAKKQQLPDERRALAVLLTGEDEIDLLRQLKTILADICPHAEVSSAEPPVYYHPRQYGCLEGLGHLGTIHPTVTTQFDLGTRKVMVLELDLTALLDQQPDYSYTPLPKYPTSRRDISLLIPDNDQITFARIKDTVIKTTDLAQAVELVELYRGEEIPAGMRSITVSVVFGSSERTLTDGEIAKATEQITKKLSSLGASER